MYGKKKVFTVFVASVILCLLGVATTGKADSIPGTSVSPEYSSLPEKKVNLPTKDVRIPVDTESHSTTVFGNDDRTIIKDTSASPYAKIVLIVSHFSWQPENTVMIGTGELISPNVVLTAGHVVLDKSHGNSTPESIDVYSGVKPSGDSFTAKLTAKGSSSGCVNAFKTAALSSSQQLDNDLGYIKLNSKIGSTTGTFGVTTSVSQGENLTLTGFSHDKYPNMSSASGTVQALTTDRIFYTIDMTGGASGSGLLNASNQITGINSYENSVTNFGTRITSLKMDYINYWLGSPKAHKYGKNVTITKQDILWGNLTFTSKKADKATIGNDYSAKYIYNNPNGSSYLSLYDKNDKWAGYINKSGTKNLVPVSYNKNVTIVTKNQWFWGDLLWKTKKHSTNDYLNQTLMAKRYYTLGNGKRFYSIYSGDTWLGYVNSAYTK